MALCCTRGTVCTCFVSFPSQYFLTDLNGFSVKSQEAMEKDNMDRTSEPDLTLRSYLADAYLHPIFHSFENVETVEVRVDKNQTCVPSPTSSETSSASPPHQYVSPPQYTSPPQYVYHYEFEP